MFGPGGLCDYGNGQYEVPSCSRGLAPRRQADGLTRVMGLDRQGMLVHRAGHHSRRIIWIDAPRLSARRRNGPLHRHALALPPRAGRWLLPLSTSWRFFVCSVDPPRDTASSNAGAGSQLRRYECTYVRSVAGRHRTRHWSNRSTPRTPPAPRTS